LIEEEQQLKDPESAAHKINDEVSHEEDNDRTPGFCEALWQFDGSYLVLHAIQMFTAGLGSMVVLGFTFLAKDYFHLDPSAT